MKIKKELFLYFEKAGTLVHYHPDDLIYMQEDTSNCLYLIISGRVRVFLMTQSGDELTFEILEKGNICDYLSTRLKRAYTYDRYEKVASFLLELTAREDPEKDIVNQTIPYSHEEISTFIGLSRVTTTKVLNEFQRNGLIKLAYKKVQVLDKKGLSQYLR